MGGIRTDGGAIARRQLTERGLSDGEIRALIRGGRLSLLRRGWYQTPGADPEVVAALRAGGVLSCVSALGRHGIWVPPGYTDSHIRASEHGRRVSGPRFCSPYGDLPAPVRAVDPILPALACAARCLPGDEFVAVCDSVLNTRPHWELADLEPTVAGAPARVRSLLDRVDGRADSGTESLTRVRLRAKRVKLRIQVTIPDVGRVDVLIGRSLIVECDSRRHHLGDGYQRDRDRDRAARLRGYHPIRLTWADVMYRWDVVEKEILALMRRGLHRTTTLDDF